MRHILSVLCFFSLTYLSADPIQNEEAPSFFEALELFLNQSGKTPNQTDARQEVTSSLKGLLQEIKEETKDNDPNKPMLIVDNKNKSNG